MANLLGNLANGPIAVRTSEGVAHVIRKAILGGILPPGKPLPERELAEELNVSRTPVREALFTLQGEGLIDLAPGRRARVRQIAASEIEQIYSLRQILECHACRCAAEIADGEKLKQIDDALAAQLRVGAAGSAAEQAQADLAFHEAIANAAGTRLVSTLMRQVLAVTVANRSGYKYSERDARRVYSEHGAIVKAIRAGDAEGADALMRKHISKSCELAMKRLQRPAPILKDSNPKLQH